MGKDDSKQPSKNGYYSLTEVIRRINEGSLIIRPNATREAFQTFEWTESDIKAAYRKLKPQDFYKTGKLKNHPDVPVDIYKATINGERIYTHFYFSGARIIINSFHE